MNAPVIIDPPLAKLRAPFPENQVSKLPKETRAQIDARKTDKSVMVWKCDVCGGAHHKNAVHLDYVGHAALTDRLLDTDIEWSWEPVAFNAEGLPAFDRNGGLWIRLTVCGVTRLGYGSADGKAGGDAIKEIIGDALRNAAMRFGAALDLWHKGDLHAEEEAAPEGGSDKGQIGGSSSEPTGPATSTRDMPFPQGPAKNKTELKSMGRALWREVEGCGDSIELSCLLGIPENVELVAQLKAALPAWWDGYERDGQVHDGLCDVISRKEKEFTAIALENANGR